MKYMGSKRRIAKYILPIMLAIHKGDKNFYDMFTGGGELICTVPDEYKKFGIDINSIPALSLIKNNINAIPKNNKEFNENDYNYWKEQKNEYCLNEEFLKYVGYAFSCSGKFFGGWCRDSKNKRDYVAEAYRNAEKQSSKLKKVNLYNCSYDDIFIKKNSLIYCDPPHYDATKYNKVFNYEKFWEWCRIKSKKGHSVFISEYNAPDDFECIWQKEINSSLTKDAGSKKGVEKLFIYNQGGIK